jgi:hypothetical protein
MLRRRTHKFTVQTKGLDDEQAAHLLFLVCSAADSFDVEYRAESTVPLKTLREVYPGWDWHRESGTERS